MQHLAPMRTLSVPVGFQTVRRTDGNEFNQRDLNSQVNEKIVAKCTICIPETRPGQEGTLFFGCFRPAFRDGRGGDAEATASGPPILDAKTPKYQRKRAFDGFQARASSMWSAITIWSPKASTCRIARSSSTAS